MHLLRPSQHGWLSRRQVKTNATGVRSFSMLSTAFRPIALPLALLAAAVLCAGCASSDGSAMSKPMEWLGLKKPEVSPESAQAIARAAAAAVERKVPLRIHAGEQLNTDGHARSLSVVVKVYQLKDASAFLAAPVTAFKDADSEKAAFGSDVIAARELVLSPGQKYEVVETVPVSVGQVAVVAMFRSPAAGRWRFAFATRNAEKSGITLGVHGCAMSVAAGEPLNTPPELMRLAGVQCR